MTGDDMTKEVEELLACRRRKEYSDVIEKYRKLDKREQNDKFVLMSYGDSSYEEGDDLESLRAYLTLATKYPKSRARNFALIGAAVALKNLQLQVEAKKILGFVATSHPGLKDEVEHSIEILERQSKAKEILSKFKLR